MSKATRQAPKTNLTRKLAIARAVTVYGKTIEEAAMIYGINERKARRSVDFVKAKAGVRTNAELAHWFHSVGMGFCNESTKDDYLKRNREWREAA